MADAIVDSCCLIYLYAAGNLAALLTAQGARWHVPEKVLQESLFVRSPDPNDASVLIPQAVDLTPTIQAGLLHRCDLAGQAELDLFVRLATTLDDGEATCLAIAHERGWALATDDRKGRREAGKLGVPVVTTAELVKAWADATGAGDAAIAVVLRNIQTCARFVPHRTMPLQTWWLDAVAGGSP